MVVLNRTIVAVVAALLLSACAEKTEQFSAANEKLFTQAGDKVGAEIKTKETQGYLVFGPYLSLEPGVYRLVGRGNLAGGDGSIGAIDVAVNKGQTILAEKPIIATEVGSREIFSLVFETKKPVSDAEFRIKVSGQTKGVFTAYELTKIAKTE